MELQQVFEQIAVDLGAQVVGAEQLTGGVSATVYALDLRADADSELQRVVFRHFPRRLLAEPTFKEHQPDGVAVEFGVLQLLHANRFAVARPLLLSVNHHYLVTEFVEGTTQVDVDQLHDALDQMADFLVALHRIDPSSISVDLPKPEDPASSCLSYLPDTETGREVRAALAGVSREPNPPVLTHGDYWPGNVLWHDGQLAAVIDWEDTRLEDPLADLATARVELLCQYDEDAMDYFTDQYLAQARVRTDALAVWEIYSSAAALATMHQWGLEKAEEAHRRAATTAFFERAVASLS